MANYSLVVNSKFNPYSVEHYLQPYKEYERVYKELEDDLTTLDESDDWAAQIGNDPTYGTKYAEYKKNMDDLNSKLQYGANLRELKSAFSTARSLYRNDIAPAKTRVENRAKYADEQRALKRANPNLYIDVDYASMDLGNEALDKPASYKVLNGDDVYKHASLSGTSLGKKLRNPDAKYQSTEDNMFVERQLQYGFTEKELTDAINGNSSNSILNDTISKLRSRYNYDNATQEEQDFINNNIYLGLKDTARATYENDVRPNPGYTRPKTKAEKEFEELQLKTARMQYEQSLILNDKKTGLPIGKWNEDKGEYELFDTRHVDTRTEEQKIIDSTPYALFVSGLQGNVEADDHGFAENSGGRARPGSTRSQTVEVDPGEGGKFSLSAVNKALKESQGQVVTTLDTILDAYENNENNTYKAQKALADKGIHINAEMLDVIIKQTASRSSEWNDKTSSNQRIEDPLKGLSRNHLYVLAINTQKGSSDRIRLGNLDYVIVNRAIGDKYLEIGDSIDSYNMQLNRQATDNEGL